MLKSGDMVQEDAFCRIEHVITAAWIQCTDGKISKMSDSNIIVVIPKIDVCVINSDLVLHY